MPTEPNSKATFVLYYSHWSAIKNLPNEKLGRLFRSIYERELHGTPFDLSDDPELYMAYSFISIQLDFDREKWEQKREARINAGKKSGEVRRKKSEQKKQMIDSQNKDEQNEHLFDSSNNAKQNEQMSDLPNKTNKAELNVYVNEYVDVNVDDDDDGDGDKSVGAVATTNTITSNSSYDFWDLYPVFYFRGFKDPVQITKDFVSYYEDQNWTLRGGRILYSLGDKLKKARKWAPKDISQVVNRTDMDFLASWNLTWEKMKHEQTPEAILKAALDDRIKVEYNNSAKSMTIHLPGAVAEYIDQRPSLLEPLIELRREKGLRQVLYNPLNDTSMAKYHLNH